MNKPVYRFEVQLTPKLNNGAMQHYWHIFCIEGNATNGNRITVKSGFTSTVMQAFKQANDLLPSFS